MRLFNKESILLGLNGIHLNTFDTVLQQQLQNNQC